MCVVLRRIGADVYAIALLTYTGVSSISNFGFGLGKRKAGLVEHFFISYLFWLYGLVTANTDKFEHSIDSQFDFSSYRYFIQ